MSDARTADSFFDRPSRLPFNFGYVIDPWLAGSSTPAWSGDVADALSGLRAEGIRAVLSLDEAGVSPALLREYDFAHLHCPIEDFTAPSIEQVEQCVDFMRRHIEKREPVVVHCRAGIGRTGTLLSCYLVRYGPMSASEGIAETRLRRPGSLETPEQEALVHAYEQYLKER